MSPQDTTPPEAIERLLSTTQDQIASIGKTLDMQNEALRVLTNLQRDTQRQLTAHLLERPQADTRTLWQRMTGKSLADGAR